MSQLGMGVMINMLGGNAGTADAIKSAIGRVIASAKLSDNALVLRFPEGDGVILQDDGQSCCESRYMRTDDDLSKFAGATVLNFETADAPSPTPEDDYGNAHDVQFLNVTTSLGVMTFSNHVEHNGYYGGFWIKASKVTA